MIEIKATLKNNDTIYFYSRNRKHAIMFFNDLKKNKAVKEIKTNFITKERGKE